MAFTTADIIFNNYPLPPDGAAAPSVPPGGGGVAAGGSPGTAASAGNGLDAVAIFGNPKFDFAMTSYPDKTVDATPINLIPIEAGAIRGARALYRIIANGVAANAPKINGAAIVNWDNAAGAINVIEWIYTGTEYLYECRQVN
jgi:hypothetical protein